MKVHITPTAFGDIGSILDYLTEVSPSSATRFTDRVEAIIADLEVHPEIGALTAETGIRRINLRPFAYAVFYEIVEDTVVVHLLRHGARHPEAFRVRANP